MRSREAVHVSLKNRPIKEFGFAMSPSLLTKESETGFSRGLSNYVYVVLR